MSIFGFELPASAIVLGMITGLTYGLLSAGIVIVFRSNRIINFAHGEMGAFGAGIFGLATIRWNVPYYLSLPVALAVGAGVAAVSEVAVIRRLRRAPRLMSIVATLGVGQFLVALALAINNQAGAGRIFPEPPGMPVLQVGALRVTPSYTATLVFAPVVVVCLALFLQRSRFGLALRGASSNPEAARMSGVFASRMSTLAWAIAGALSTFTAILVLPTIGLATGSSFGPGLLLRALVGAVVARMTNLTVALASGLVLGVVEGLLLANYPRGGLVEVVLFGIILVALLAQAREGARDEDRGNAWAAVQPWRPLPDALKRVPAVRNLGNIVGGLALLLAVVLPLFLSNNRAVTLTSILGLATVALSVGIITGLGGQLTLGQFAFGAIGAVASYHVTTRTGGNVPLGLVYGGLAAAAASLIIGLPALRIRGLFLTVTTLSFAVVVPSWVLQQPWALGDGVDPGRAVIAGRSLDTGRSYYYFMLAVFVLVFLVARNVRRTGFGRLLVAIRDNEDNARAFTVNARRVKIQGFLLAGFVAGVGGAAYAHAFSSVEAGTFLTRYSTDVVVMTVIGGISILSGPVLGAAFVLGLPAFLPLDAAFIAATRFGLLVVLLYAPGGLVQWLAPLRARLIERLARGHDTSSDDEADTLEYSRRERLSGFRVRTEATAPHARPLERVGRAAHMLEAIGVEKRYGGVHALSQVTIRVERGETLGLIGPNGAGKTTLFEVLGGFTRPDAGGVVFDGEVVTGLAPEARAKLGLIRSFQDAALFPTMTVLESVQLALERTTPTSFAGSILGLRGRDRRREERARELVASMGLWAYRNKQAQELSTGTRRITEIACLVALEPRLLLLDEPSSGIAQRETEALGSLLRDLKEQLDLTLVVIEHDIPLIMGLSDRIVAMDAGVVIAEGQPDVVRTDPQVVEAYLGGKIEAIERSGTVSANGSAREVADLPEIAGLGPARRAALLEAFGSVDSIRHATVDDIAAVDGFGRRLAERVLAEVS